MTLDFLKKAVLFLKKREIRVVEHWFSTTIIGWYSKNKRDLPWRSSKNPYNIWLSEIILQQTQVKQGLPYYLRFIKQFPSIRHLAQAKEDDVLKLWQGLGYYSRARNLHHTAKFILSEHKGKFPEKYTEIRRLKGVGDYTAAAIASFAFDLPYAVVDGNVYRLLSRLFGIREAIDSGKGKVLFRDLAQELLPEKMAALYNQAIMEFGSGYCKPKKPDCPNCVFSERCIAYRKGWVDTLPFKAKAIKQSTRHFHYLVFLDSTGNTMIRKRNDADIWKGLYEFPLVEGEMEEQGAELYKSFRKYSGRTLQKKQVVYKSQFYIHQLSHQKILARFYVIKSEFDLPEGYKKANWKRIENYAVPRLIHKFIEGWESMEKNYI